MFVNFPIFTIKIIVMADLLRLDLSWSFMAVLFVTIYITSCVKYRYFSPISDIPGPFLASFSQLWRIMAMLRGDEIEEFYDLHQKYGPFVRIGPNEVSISHEDAPQQLLLNPLDKVYPAVISLVVLGWYLSC